MRPILLFAGAVFLCPSVGRASHSPETTRIEARKIDLQLVNPAAKADLRAALNTNDPQVIFGVQERLRKSQAVYVSWFNNPAAAVLASNDPDQSEQFRKQWDLLKETLPPATMASLYHLKLKRLGFTAPEEAEETTVADSTIPPSDDLNDRTNSDRETKQIVDNIFNTIFSIFGPRRS